ncbi:MAG: aldehyde dehydrogenase family protein [Ilumatobacteraceae bacterium]
MLAGGNQRRVDGAEQGYYVEPTVLEGDNSIACSRRRSSAPWWRSPRSRAKQRRSGSRTTRCTASVPGSGPVTAVPPTGSDGRSRPDVWTNCYHAYPAHAAFGGYKGSGIGRENHLMMLEHYQQTKNLLVSYSPQKLGFF